MALVSRQPIFYCIQDATEEDIYRYADSGYFVVMGGDGSAQLATLRQRSADPDDEDTGLSVYMPAECASKRVNPADVLFTSPHFGWIHLRTPMWRKVGPVHIERIPSRSRHRTFSLDSDSVRTRRLDVAGAFVGSMWGAPRVLGWREANVCLAPTYPNTHRRAVSDLTKYGACALSPAVCLSYTGGGGNVFIGTVCVGKYYVVDNRIVARGEYPVSNKTVHQLINSLR